MSNNYKDTLEIRLNGCCSCCKKEEKEKNEFQDLVLPLLPGETGNEEEDEMPVVMVTEENKGSNERQKIENIESDQEDDEVLPPNDSIKDKEEDHLEMIQIVGPDDKEELCEELCFEEDQEQDELKLSKEVTSVIKNPYVPLTREEKRQQRIKELREKNAKRRPETKRSISFVDHEKELKEMERENMLSMTGIIKMVSEGKIIPLLKDLLKIKK